MLVIKTKQNTVTDMKTVFDGLDMPKKKKKKNVWTRVYYQ